MAPNEQVVTIAAVGDVGTGHEPPESAFTHVLETLRSADVRFAQVERLYSERGSYQGQGDGRASAQSGVGTEAVFSALAGIPVRNG